MELWEVWTDGACEPNPGSGGWAYLLKPLSGGEILKSGSCLNSTNNRMEFIAAIEALKSIPEGAMVNLFTDSQLLVNTMSQWVHRWIREKKYATKKNTDLIDELLKQCQTKKVNWYWVRGHSGNVNNERVDRMAFDAARNQ